MFRYDIHSTFAPIQAILQNQQCSLFHETDKSGIHAYGNLQPPLNTTLQQRKPTINAGLPYFPYSPFQNLSLSHEWVC